MIRWLSAGKQLAIHAKRRSTVQCLHMDAIHMSPTPHPPHTPALYGGQVWGGGGFPRRGEF